MVTSEILSFCAQLGLYDMTSKSLKIHMFFINAGAHRKEVPLESTRLLNTLPPTFETIF